MNMVKIGTIFFELFILVIFTLLSLHFVCLQLRKSLKDKTKDFGYGPECHERWIFHVLFTFILH